MYHLVLFFNRVIIMIKAYITWVRTTEYFFQATRKLVAFFYLFLKGNFLR